MVRLLAIILTILFSPILLLITIAIYIDDGFPIFFKQRRLGNQNTHFWIYKFRTMKNKTPDIPTHLIENRSDLYIKTGPFLRKYSLDEIPQLFNIIKGELTFIGPRPALYNQDDLIAMRTNKGIHQLIPGITGWAQVNGRDMLSIEKKVKMDEYYLKHKSFWLDVKILWLTIFKVFNSADVSH